MSKLFELMRESAQGSDRANAKFKSCTLTVFADGTAQVSMNGKWLAAGGDEGELVARLADQAVQTEKGK